MTRATTSPLRPWALRVAAVAGPAAMALAASWAAFDTHRATSWHFFRDAARLVFAGAPAHGGGLDVFLSHPEFQFGPLSIVAGAPFALAPQSLAVPAVIALGTLLGVVVALSVEAAATPGRPAPGGALAPVAPLAGAVALAVVWADVGVRTAHIDDAIALAATALACAGVARGRGATATAALAVAAAAKPWALAFAPLAAAAPGLPARRAARRHGGGGLPGRPDLRHRAQWTEEVGLPGRRRRRGRARHRRRWDHLRRYRRRQAVRAGAGRKDARAFTTGGDVRASAAVGNGVIYVGSFDSQLYAVKLDGTLAWTFRAGDRIVSSALVDVRGAILFGSQDDCLYCLEPDGHLRWSVELGGDVDSSPTLAADGTISVGSDDRKLYALRATAGAAAAPK